MSVKLPGALVPLMTAQRLGQSAQATTACTPAQPLPLEVSPVSVAAVSVEAVFVAAVCEAATFLVGETKALCMHQFFPQIQWR